MDGQVLTTFPKGEGYVRPEMDVFWLDWHFNKYQNLDFDVIHSQKEQMIL